MNWFSKLLSHQGDYKAYSTPGGIKPRRRKSSSLRSKIMPMPLPELLVLNLKQRSYKPLKPVVSIGDSVSKYQLLAEPNSSFDMPLYAPCAGRIEAITPMPVMGETGVVSPCILLATDGSDRECAARPLQNITSASSEEILTALHEFAIGGLGGAGFPASVKLRKAKEAGVDLLIINGAECEPYISCDEALMRERATAVVAGAKLLKQACSAKRCILAVEDHKKQAINAIRSALTDEDIGLALVKTKYPAGSEKQLIQSLTARQVPLGSEPIAIGVVVQNVGTAFSAYQAFTIGQPNISRITTLVGGPLRTPKNFEALYGTPVSFLQKLCGLDETKITKTVIGGPLMGESYSSGDAYISRATNCAIAADTLSFAEPAAEMPCIRCGDCADACPVKLLPQQLYSSARSQNAIQLKTYQLDACIECGACSYVCPSKIPLVDYFKAGKHALADENRKQQQSEAWQKRFQSHQIRIKTEKDAALNKRALKDTTKPSKIKFTPMSRETAQSEIAAAVARVKNKKAKYTTPKRSE